MTKELLSLAINVSTSPLAHITAQDCHLEIRQRQTGLSHNCNFVGSWLFIMKGTSRCHPQVEYVSCILPSPITESSLNIQAQRDESPWYSIKIFHCSLLLIVQNSSIGPAEVEWVKLEVETQHVAGHAQNTAGFSWPNPLFSSSLSAWGTWWCIVREAGCSPLLQIRTFWSIMSTLVSIFFPEYIPTPGRGKQARPLTASATSPPSRPPARRHPQGVQAPFEEYFVSVKFQWQLYVKSHLVSGSSKCPSHLARTPTPPLTARSRTWWPTETSSLWRTAATWTYSK